MEPLLIFNVSNQEIERMDDFTVVESSVAYLKAQFNFLTDDWAPMTIITGVFIMEDGTPIPSLADENGICEVPEAWLVKQKGYIGVIGSDGTTKITTRAAKVSIREKGYTTEKMQEETQGYFDQIMQSFAETKAFVAQEADRAETAEKSAEAWTHGHEDYPEREEDNAAYYTGKAHEDAIRTAADRAAVVALTEHTEEVNDTVSANFEQVKTLTSQAQTAAENALQSEANAKASRESAETAQAGAEAAEGQAELYAAQTGEDAAAVEVAKTFVMQMSQGVADNKAFVEQTVGEFEFAHQQAVADVNNAGQMQTERVQEAGGQAVDDITEAKTGALSEINSAGTTQKQAVEDVGTAKTEEVNAAGATQLKAVNDAGATQTAAVKQEGTTQVTNVQEAAADIIADRDQIEINRQNILKNAIKRTTSGKTIVLTDGSESPFLGLRQYGRTEQDGIPSMDNPVELVSAGDKGNIETAVTGKNLIKYPYASKFETLNGITYSVSDDGVITADGTTDAGTNFNLCTDLTLYPGAYTLSGMSEFTGMNLLIYDIDKKVVLCTLEAGTNSKMFVADKKYTSVMVYLNIGFVGTKVTGKAYPMLQLGSEATTYEPYKTQTLTMLTPNGLPGIPVTSGGNYTDETGQQWIADYRDWGRGVDVQCVGRWQYTDENITMSTIIGANRFTISAGLSNVRPESGYGYCDMFKYSYVPINANNIDDAIVVHGGGNVYARCDAYQAAEEFKAALIEKKPTCLYILATPIETPIPPEELAAYHALHTNYPYTTVYTDEGVWMDMEYATDTEECIDTKVQEGNIMIDETTGKKYILGMKGGLLTVFEVIE